MSQELHTADPHFFHKNIIEFCARPYRTLDKHPDVAAMNAALVANWNARAAPGDIVYVAGDFAYRFPKPRHVREILEQLNGTKVLIKGNHDYRLTDRQWRELGFAEVHDSLIVRDVYLIHKAPTELEWFAMKNKHPQLKYVFCGHVHEKWARRGDFINVGVDVRSYRPATYQELIT